MTSGARHPYCSTISRPIVFLPSMRYGSRSVEASKTALVGLGDEAPDDRGGVPDEPVDEVQVRAGGDAPPAGDGGAPARGMAMVARRPARAA